MKYSYFDQPGWGHKGSPVLVGMGDMMQLIVSARHGGSRLRDPTYWPSGKDPTKDPAGTWGGTWITEGDLAELQRLAGKKDTRGGLLGKIPGIGKPLSKALSELGKIPLIGKYLPYAGGPLAPLVGTASLLKDARGYITQGYQFMKPFIPGGKR
jgi:hypothetical protein